MTLTLCSSLNKTRNTDVRENCVDLFNVEEYYFVSIIVLIFRWLGGLLVERRTSVSPIRGSIPGQGVAAVKNLGQ